MSSRERRYETSAVHPRERKPRGSRAPVQLGLRVLALFLLGFATTFAVSACCSVFVRPTISDRIMELDGRLVDGVPIEVFAKPGSAVAVRFVTADTLFQEDFSRLATRNLSILLLTNVRFADWRPAREFGMQGVHAHGWPFPAFAYRSHRNPALDALRTVSGAFIWGSPTQDGDGLLIQKGDPLAIGLQPIWIGLLLDTGIYAIVWFALITIVRVLRRQVRVPTAHAALRLALVSLVLGVATSIAVALVCARMVDLLSGGATSSSEYMTESDGRSRFLSRSSAPGVIRWSAIFNQEPGKMVNFLDSRKAFAGTLGPSWTDYLQLRDAAYGRRIVHATGWPAPCLWGGVNIILSAVGEPTVFTPLHAVITVNAVNAKAREPARIVPFAPIWSGLAVNTAVYATVWFVLITCAIGPLRMMRANRIAHGRCPRCRYRFGTAERCSECGTEIAAERAKIERSLNRA